jgi:restriction system protein
MSSQPTIWGLHHSGGLSLVDDGWIAIGWPQAGDLTDLPDDREAFKDRLRERFSAKSESWVANAAGQLLRFRHVMAVGDLVVYPRKADRTINIGRITGEYAYDESRSERYPNGRAVEWLKQGLSREQFSQGCLYEFGSALSVFTITTHAGEVLAAIGSQAPPVVPPTVPTDGGASTPPAEDEPSVERITELTQDFVLKTFQIELKGHGFSAFCGWLLEAMGYTTQVSPPGTDQGVDIVASEDALGVRPPLLKVQCKSGGGKVGSPDVQALNGTLGPTDQGVFFAVGDFTPQAEQAAGGMPRMRLIGPIELVELILDDATQRARRIDQPHTLGQDIHNVSSSTPARPGRARPTWRSPSRSAPASPATASRSRPRPNGSPGSPRPSALTASTQSSGDCRSSRCSWSTKWATSRSTPRPPT